MKFLLLATFLSWSLVVVAPGWTEDGDYKQMISEFEKFRSAYQQDLLKMESERQEPQSDSVKTDVERDELQKRWNQLVKGIFKKESFFYLDEDDREKMETLRIKRFLF